MPIYTLRFTGDDRQPAKSVDFEAEDASTALIIAHREASRHSAELWCHGKPVCTIKRTGKAGEVWQIGPVAAAH